jgi:hypothetical protein
MAHTKQSAARAVKRDFAQCIATGNSLAAANDEPEPDIETSSWPMPSLEPIKAFRDIEAEAQAEARAIVAEPIDDDFFARADATEPTAEQKFAREYERALDAQVQRQGVRG